VYPCKLAKGLPAGPSRSFTVWSSEPEARTFPSGLRLHLKWDPLLGDPSEFARAATENSRQTQAPERPSERQQNDLRRRSLLSLLRPGVVLLDPRTRRSSIGLLLFLKRGPQGTTSEKAARLPRLMLLQADGRASVPPASFKRRSSSSFRT